MERMTMTMTTTIESLVATPVLSTQCCPLANMDYSSFQLLAEGCQPDPAGLQLFSDSCHSCD